MSQTKNNETELTVPVESQIVSVGAGAIAMIFTMINILALTSSVLGLGILIIGLRLTKRGLVTLGSTLLFGAVIFAAVAGIGPQFVLIGSAGTLIAWDTAEFAITHGRQVGSENIRRTQLTHIGATVSVTAIGVIASFLIYRIISPGQPTAVLVLLLVGAILLVLAAHRSI